MRAFRLVFPFLLLLVSTISSAQERHLGPHVHGQASVNISVEGQIMDVAASLPGHDAVGFEHPPGSPAESSAVMKASAALKQAAWFVPPASAHCILETASVSPHGFGGATEPGGHADFDAAYHYVCSAPDHLDHFAVRLSAVFPAVQKVVVNLITPSGSAQQTLEGGATQVNVQP